MVEDDMVEEREGTVIAKVSGTRKTRQILQNCIIFFAIVKAPKGRRHY